VSEITLIDSHAHLSRSEFLPDIDALLLRAQQAGIETIINICTSIETLSEGLVLAERYPWVYNTASTTPHDVEKEGESAFAFIAEQARMKRLVAIGETGLDYYYQHSVREIQKDFLRRYLHLALECQLPVVIHCREAFKDFFEIIDAEYVIDQKHAPGVLHCFTGTIQEAEEILKRGWFLSLSGIVTFKKSSELQEVAKAVPLDQLLIETDSPYLAPQGKRGKVNEPAYLQETAAFIAHLKGVSLQELAEATKENTRRLFNLNHSSCRVRNKPLN